MESIEITIARKFHEAYERLAVSRGYETNELTREFKPGSPNGMLMRAVVLELIEAGIIINQ